MKHAEDIRIDCDDGRFTLSIDTDEGWPINVDIHDIVLEFYDNVRHTIGPYAEEAALARAEHARSRSYPQPIYTRPISVEDAVDAGYALDDPKSPGYHDRMVGDN